MSIKFDFNNMFSSSVGDHGASQQDINEILPEAQKAASHLKKIISNPRARVKLNLEWAKLPEQDKADIGQIQKLGREISRKYENVIFLGIGGSCCLLRRFG